MKKYEAIVIGGGHAGIEAAFALNNMGHNVALISLDKNMLASMPCNPAIGGPAKGILTREIDALGGMQGIFSDKAMIQIKMLNESRGPAVRALRAQIDKDKYSTLVLEEVQNSSIDLIEVMVIELLSEEDKVIGVKLSNGEVIKSNIVIITTGTYMDSSILRGDMKRSEGPDYQQTTNLLSESLKKLGISMQRLKTGTPPRVWSDSIDFSELQEEKLNLNNFSFSNRTNISLSKQINCFIAYTNEKTHKVVRDNMKKSSLYSGLINGIGPRYCPSIEDKIVRFFDKNRHQLFYEPTTAKGDIMYINGFSSSMPIEVQKKMLATLPGMKNAKVKRWAYAIEYDAIDPLQLKPSLEVKNIDGLFMAGQVNGTSGYEEAAAQGLIAGINAARKIEGKESIVIGRSQGYIGVLIDDLVIKGTKEPYRMLTSRAEYRLLLRNDNADKRMLQIGEETGLLDKEYIKKTKEKYEAIEKELKRLEKTFLSSNSDLAKKYNISNGPSLLELLKRPEVDIHDISDSPYIYEVSVEARLKGYIRKQETEAKKIARLDNFKIPKDLDYNDVQNLATEAKQKLIKISPETIGQASRISGINPADIQMLMFHIEYKRKKNED